MKEWVHVLEKDENIWDQNAFNDLMRRNRSKTFSDHSFEGYDGLKFGVLPVATFASGHTFYVQQNVREEEVGTVCRPRDVSIFRNRRQKTPIARVQIVVRRSGVLRPGRGNADD